jgi:N utilization substance protein B
MAGRGQTAKRASSRSAARLAAVQALYQMDMTGIDLNEVIAEFEQHRLGKEIEGTQYCDAEAAFFRDSSRSIL